MNEEGRMRNTQYINLEDVRICRVKRKTRVRCPGFQHKQIHGLDV